MLVLLQGLAQRNQFNIHFYYVLHSWSSKRPWKKSNIGGNLRLNQDLAHGNIARWGPLAFDYAEEHNLDFEINLCDKYIWHLGEKSHCLDQNIKVYFRFRIYKSNIMALFIMIGRFLLLGQFARDSHEFHFTFGKSSLGRHISLYHAFKIVQFLKQKAPLDGSFFHICTSTGF